MTFLAHRCSLMQIHFVVIASPEVALQLAKELQVPYCDILVRPNSNQHPLFLWLETRMAREFKMDFSGWTVARAQFDEMGLPYGFEMGKVD